MMPFSCSRSPTLVATYQNVASCFVIKTHRCIVAADPYRRRSSPCPELYVSFKPPPMPWACALCHAVHALRIASRRQVERHRTRSPSRNDAPRVIRRNAAGLPHIFCLVERVSAFASGSMKVNSRRFSFSGATPPSPDGDDFGARGRRERG